MRKSRFSESQIVAILKEARAGVREGATGREDWRRFLDGCRFWGLIVVIRWVLEMWILEMMKGIKPL